MGKSRVSLPSLPGDEAPTLRFRDWSVGLSVLAAALAWAMVQVARQAWTTDDAYISFRYAANLNDGLGLVFNAGERVEGYSNFLWTLWCAVGLRLGVPAETWAQGSGAVCYAITLILLAVLAFARRRAGVALPVAALLGALHPDWQRFATGGLETAAFTLLATAGYVLLVLGRGRVAAGWAAAALGLATLTRPDGLLFALAGGAFLLVDSPRRLARLATYAGVLAAIGLPYAAWKLAYYGDLLPNTYYAKSGASLWLSQGLVYVGYYVHRYWMVMAGLPLAAWAWFSERERQDREWNRAVALAAAFAILYLAWVIGVGGDFMFARFLIPITPFALVLLERALERLDLRGLVPRMAVAAGLAALVVLTPRDFSGGRMRLGIVDEWDQYRTYDREGARQAGREMADLFAGLPVRIGFSGTQAILAYYSRAPVAIETSAGLTDSFIAHRRLKWRGRVGHEKKAPLSYLIETRRLHFLVFDSEGLRDSLKAYIPVLPIRLAGRPGFVLYWDPPVMSALRERGARFHDFPAELDAYRDHMSALSDEWVAEDYTLFRRFYFDHVNDPRRERAFRARVTTAAATAAAPLPAEEPEAATSPRL